MWIPKDETEILSVVNSGSLQETASFDAKAQVSSDNTEIAKDIAAMTSDGGVIIYGIGEDANKRLTVLSPVELAGQPERINSIALTSISEPPTIHVHAFPTIADPSKGYIVVAVPPSPRAPHMVTIKKSRRYYGRTSSGNYSLNEGEVARLYARRQQMEVDRNDILQREIKRYPFEPNPRLAYLYAFIRPVYLQTNNLLKRTCQEGQSIQDALWGLVRGANKRFTRQDYAPRLDSPNQWLPTVDGYRGDVGWIDKDYPQNLDNLIRLEIDHNGHGHIFCGRAADTIKKGEHELLYFIPSIVAGNVAQFLYLFGSIYDKTEYYGHVDLGVAITGLRGCLPYSNSIWPRNVAPYDQGEYHRTTRCLAGELLNNTNVIAAELVMPLIQAICRGEDDPFLS